MLHNTQLFMNFHILVRSANESVVLFQSCVNVHVNTERALILHVVSVEPVWSRTMFY